ncbi:MAG TPA: glycosyltransferase family 1 protein [Gaiellaceae bacterium]|nr:glycosyltransferase family 1 protein [Gaiellaceae bacterium]
MIGISMLTLVPGVMGGSETYARELTKALERVGRLEYRVFVPPGIEDAGGGLPTQTVTEYRATRSAAGRAAAMARAVLAPGRLREAMRLGELDAIHFPFTVMLPPPGQVPAATTILDLQHEEHPEFFSRAQLLYRRRFYRRPLLESDFVITISEHARRTILDRYPLEPDRVRAIHLAVDHGTFTADGRARESFLLYPANAWPHKNHARLFEAFALVRRERPGLRLVLTGAGHDALTLPDGVESRGHVPLVELVRLYRTAAAVVYPSLYEGFGMPCLEAMACGAPVAASNVASLPEVCGDAAVYLDPNSIESIADAIRRVLDDPPSGGIEQAAKFTWELCARQHDEVYRTLTP